MSTIDAARDATCRTAGVVAAGFVLLAAGCGEPDTFDRQQMLADTVDEVILPTHETLETRADSLQSSVETFCEDDRTESELDAARSDWRELQAPLKEIQAWSFNMSPYRGASFETPMYQIDREPADGEAIESILDDSDTTVDRESIAQQDYTRSAKGYPAAEYLLFGTPGDQETMALYQNESNHPDRRCDYLVATVRHAAGVTSSYTKAWSRSGGNFAETFATRRSDDSDWTTIQDSIDAMVSQMVFVTKTRVSKNLLGGPLGQHTDNANIPDRVSAPYAGASLAQLQSTLDGFEKLYGGADGSSLADYTEFRKASVHDLVEERLGEARTAIDEVPEPLSKAVDDSTQQVEGAQQKVDELTATVEADLKTTLGASTTKVVVDSD